VDVTGGREALPGVHVAYMYCPKPGQNVQRIKLEGYTMAAARNRVPPDLAGAVAKAQWKGRYEN
jgi:hypothetical protein